MQEHTSEGIGNVSVGASNRGPSETVAAVTKPSSSKYSIPGLHAFRLLARAGTDVKTPRAVKATRLIISACTRTGIRATPARAHHNRKLTCSQSKCHLLAVLKHMGGCSLLTKQVFLDHQARCKWPWVHLQRKLVSIRTVHACVSFSCKPTHISARMSPRRGTTIVLTGTHSHQEPIQLDSHLPHTYSISAQPSMSVC